MKEAKQQTKHQYESELGKLIFYQPMLTVLKYVSR